MTNKPVECSQCQKEIRVSYTEIIGEEISCSEMCADCPVLDKKLHGSREASLSDSSESKPKLCCAHCMTTFETIQTGGPLGCSHCYVVFEKLLLNKLVAEDLVPPLMQKEVQNNTTTLVHRGTFPNQTITIPASNQLSLLNEALNEALQKEHYEQAAWLRDQIKELTEGAGESKK